VWETKVADPSWAPRHWKTLSQSYARAPHFPLFQRTFEELYARTEGMERLSLVNRLFLDELCRILGIRTKVSWSSDYGIIEGRTERLVDLCRKTGATRYLSGPLARNYIDEALFQKAGIELAWMDYAGYPEYEQLYPPFVHEVTVLDLLFHTGPDARKHLLTF
jgi:hypothetical protein